MPAWSLRNSSLRLSFTKRKTHFQGVAAGVSYKSHDSNIKVKWCVTCRKTQDLLVYTRKLEQPKLYFVRCAGRIFKQIYLVVRLRVLICS